MAQAPGQPISFEAGAVKYINETESSPLTTSRPFHIHTKALVFEPEWPVCSFKGQCHTD